VQGFRKFYLYDNESSDDYLSVVQPWRDAGLVELIVFPGKGKQSEMYDDCLQRARGRVDWLAFIDDDEFLFAAENETIESILKQFDHTAGLAVNWVLFGSSGQQNAESRWVVERFTRSAGGPDQHFKCIVRPDRIARCTLIGHEFETRAGYAVLTETGAIQPGPVTSSPSARRIRVNHYLIKSWGEWRSRRSRPAANTGETTPLPESSWREWDAAWSSVEDRSALRFCDDMQKILIELRSQSGLFRRLSAAN
jgi:hypothetical protein